MTNLWDGTGDPWAGQLKLNGELIPTLNEPRVSELDENLGDDVPIGSEIQHLFDFTWSLEQETLELDNSNWS